MDYQEQLTTWGYDVDLVANGKEAVDYVRKSRMNYDLCLMDVHMPVMNGIEAIQATRQGIDYLPVIACGSDPDAKAHCLDAGADDFLVKPLAIEGLQEKLGEFAVKQVVLYLDGKSLSLRWVGPADGAELYELRMLDKKGLAKFMLVDASFHFFAHKCAQNKLLHDFSSGDSLLTDILDRTRQAHNVVQIHASQIWVRKSGLTPAQFRQLLKAEDEALKGYVEPYKK